MGETIYRDKHGRALRGHDPVAYFTRGEQTKGDPAISAQWADATWLFATAEHRDLFEADPTRYAPVFGGHCAVGRAVGGSFPGSPKRWRIVDDRLYLNKNLVVALQFPLFSRRIRRLADEERRG